MSTTYDKFHTLVPVVAVAAARVACSTCRDKGVVTVAVEPDDPFDLDGTRHVQVACPSCSAVAA